MEEKVFEPGQKVLFRVPHAKRRVLTRVAGATVWPDESGEVTYSLPRFDRVFARKMRPCDDEAALGFRFRLDQPVYLVSGVRHFRIGSSTVEGIYFCEDGQGGERYALRRCVRRAGETHKASALYATKEEALVAFEARKQHAAALKVQKALRRQRRRQRAA